MGDILWRMWVAPSGRLEAQRERGESWKGVGFPQFPGSQHSGNFSVPPLPPHRNGLNPLKPRAEVRTPCLLPVVASQLYFNK